MGHVCVSLIQMDAGPDKTKNLATINQLLDQIPNETDWVILPEMYCCRNSSSVADQAEPIPGPSTQPLIEWAKTRQKTVIAGSIPEIHPSGSGRCFNTCVVITPNGDIMATYRKIHLFDCLIPGKEIRESAQYLAGDSPTILDIGSVRVGLSICYDLRFPELFRFYADQGAQVLCIPASFTKPTGSAHWEVLCRARAIENQCYVLAPNQFGKGANNVPTYGNSLIIDPWGKIIKRGSDNSPEILTATLALSVVDQVRQNLPVLTHRKL